MISNAEFWAAILDEGIDYTVTHKIQFDQLEDPKTRRLAEAVYGTMGDLEEYMHRIGFRDE